MVHSLSQPLATSSHIIVPTPSLNVIRNPSARVRQAVRDNNVSLLARLQHKTDLRNTDKNRLTSLSWAAMEGSLEVFEWLLLDYGHDDQELSRDGDNNTILHLLASIPSLSLSPFNHLLTSAHTPASLGPALKSRTYEEQSFISLRMAETYYTLFPFLLDWSNSGGKTSLHVASQCGNHNFINLLYEMGGADLNLVDLQGNTPLHYASAFGHSETIRVLLENGCNYTIRNFEGFTAMDFAYDISVLNEIQVITKELYTERRNKKSSTTAATTMTTTPAPIPIRPQQDQQGYPASASASVWLSNPRENRIRSSSLTSSANDSNAGSGSYGSNSQSGYYMNQIPQTQDQIQYQQSVDQLRLQQQQQQQQQRRQQQQQQQQQLPLSGRELGERSSSLPMSRLDSSSSISYSGSHQLQQQNLKPDSNYNHNLNFRPDIPQAQSQRSPRPEEENIANPQTVLSRPTPSPRLVSATGAANENQTQTQNRPTNDRSPSIPTHAPAPASDAHTALPSEPHGSESVIPAPPPLPTTISLPLPKEGVMMGSVMRRANSSQSGSASLDFSRGPNPSEGRI
ncbi:uncharacterized protein I303_101199 [Kwoniella dejecticola CBS 10117]|uniref:Uncharacterized protein n=1 Tax=Kwoniella dejecticola CBS 10117 TaxID=1296121 RepID=A0A1A6AH88_9TREE|nr:uncharacterized protein I303_01205 [Kwoniella dejecticola CBS 10117]OBR89378.1 hypothetical protein I303_01205 [Kwoniella dejecticola CBS 10117]